MGDLSPYACPCGCGFDNPHPHLLDQIRMLENWANRYLHTCSRTVCGHTWAEIKKCSFLCPRCYNAELQNVEYSVDIILGCCCPGHHAEVTRCECGRQGPLAEWEEITRKTRCPSPDYPGWWFKQNCPTCHGTGSTSPESYHLPRLWNTAQRKWHTCGKALHHWVKDAYHSLAADFQIERREKNFKDGTVLDKGALWSPPATDLAAMKAMTKFWADPSKPIEKQLWQGEWELHEADEPHIHIAITKEPL